MKKKQSKVTHEKLMQWAKRYGVKTKRVKAAKVNIKDMSGYLNFDGTLEPNEAPLKGWATPRSLKVPQHIANRMPAGWQPGFDVPPDTYKAMWNTAADAVVNDMLRNNGITASSEADPLGALIEWVNKYSVTMTLRELQQAAWMLEHEVKHREAAIERDYAKLLAVKPGRGKTRALRKTGKRKK